MAIVKKIKKAKNLFFVFVKRHPIQGGLIACACIDYGSNIGHYLAKTMLELNLNLWWAILLVFAYIVGAFIRWCIIGYLTKFMITFIAGWSRKNKKSNKMKRTHAFPSSMTES